MTDRIKSPDHPQRTNIAPQGLFHTPEDWDELKAWLDAHPREDRAHLYTAAVMAWNLAAKLAEGRVATALHLRAPQDASGNPRRILVAVDPDSGDPLARVDEGYRGQAGALQELRRVVPEGWTVGKYYVPIDVTVSEYKWHLERAEEGPAPE